MTEVVKENDLHKQLEEIRLLKSQRYNKKMAAEEMKEQTNIQVSQQDINDDSLKTFEELENINENSSSSDDEAIMNHQTKLNSEKPIDHLTILNDSFVTIFSLFDEDNYEDYNTQKFIQFIIDDFYNSIKKSNIDDLYTFYVSIKEICTSIDNIDIQLVVFSLDLIKMDYHFIDVLNKSNKIEYIRIIFNEFVRIIDELKLFFMV